jgi:hypothetical protein
MRKEWNLARLSPTNLLTFVLELRNSAYPLDVCQKSTTEKGNDSHIYGIRHLLRNTWPIVSQGISELARYSLPSLCSSLIPFTATTIHEADTTNPEIPTPMDP